MRNIWRTADRQTHTFQTLSTRQQRRPLGDSRTIKCNNFIELKQITQLSGQANTRWIHSRERGQNVEQFTLAFTEKQQNRKHESRVQELPMNGKYG